MSKKILFLLLTLPLAACSYNHGKDGTTDSGASLQPSTEQLAASSFSQVYSQVFSNKCAGCHNDTLTNGGVNLTHPETAKSALSQINQSALVDHSMPKAGSPPLTHDELLILTTWVQAGGPNQAGENTPAPVVIPLAPTFESISANILQPKCVGCHNPQGKAKDDPFQTLAQLSGSDAVIAGKAELSDLYNDILANAKHRMPPVSSGEAALSDAEIEVIKDWINNGAKD